MSEKTKVIVTIIVIIIGIVAVYRYTALVQQHKEAAEGFTVLLILSVITLVIFLLSLFVIYKPSRGQQERE